MSLKPRFLIVRWVILTGVIALWGFTVGASAEEPSIIALESGVYYTVKKGDTLWDISNRYFNTHWRWPQIWSENQQIMNPHRIFPGERLRLYHQLWDVPLVPEQSDMPSLVDQPVMESRYFVYSSIHRIGFIKEQPVEASGRIALIKGDKNVQKTMLGQDESIYVTPAGSLPLKVGDVYAVYRPPIPVFDPETKSIFGELKSNIGFQYYGTGLVRIVESGEGFAVAKVEKAFRHIMVNDILLPYEHRSPKIQLIPGMQDIEGKIIMAEEDIKIIGDGFVAFINKGVENGIQVGQTYAIYEEYSIDSMIDKVDFGSLLILHTEDRIATALITRSDRSFQPPSKFRTATSSQNL